MPLLPNLGCRRRPSSLLRLLRHLSSSPSPPSLSSSLTCTTSSSVPLPLDPDTVLETLSLYSNDCSRAIDFFNWASSPSGGGFTHTPSTLSRAVDILGKHFEFPQATSLISSFSASFPPSFLLPSFRSLFNRLAAAHLVSDALDAFSLAGRLGLNDRATYLLLIDALCDHGHVSDAEHLCLRSKPPAFPFTPDIKIYNCLLRGWAKVRAWKQCRDFWKEMDKAAGVRKDLHSYSIYMDALSKSGKPWKAVKLFKEMKRKRITPDTVAYNTAIHAIGQSEGVDFSIRLYREMADSGCVPNQSTLNTIVKLLCKEARFKEAYYFVGQMKKKHGCEPDVLTYHCFFQYLTRPQEILKLFERMVDAGCQPRIDTYVMLMRKFGRWGFLRPVFIVWEAMETNGCSPDAFAYNALIDAILAKGMVDLAKKYDEEMLAKGLERKRRKEFESNGLTNESGSDNALRARVEPENFIGRTDEKRRPYEHEGKGSAQLPNLR